MNRWRCMLALLAFGAHGAGAAVLVPDEIPDVGRPEGWYLDFGGGATKGTFTGPDVSGAISAMRREHQWQDALSQAERRAAVEPESLEAQAQLGDWYFLLNRLDEAAGRYWRAARLDPANANVLESFAFTLLALNDHANGLRVYERLLDIEMRPRALFNRASALAHVGRYDEAIQDWTEYLRQQPAEWRAVYNMGVAHHRAGRPEEAVRLLKSVLQARPAHPYVLVANIQLLRAQSEDEGLVDELIERLSEQFGLVSAIQLIRAEPLPIFLIR